MNITPLATCSACGVGVPPKNKNVIRSASSERGVMIWFKCPHCGVVGSTFVDSSEARKRADEIRRQERADERRKAVGRMVKGFAIDLEVVETVEDMKIFWDDQEKFSPWSIVKEKEG